MFGLRTALLIFVMVLLTAILVAAKGFTLIYIGRFRVWIWRMIASPPLPPWMRYHIGLNHGSTVADTNLIKNGRLVLRNYKTAL